MQQTMVGTAQGHEVVGVGRATVAPMHEMVNVEPSPPSTCRDPAAAVAVLDHGTQPVRDGPATAAEPHGASRPLDDGDDVGVARDKAVDAGRQQRPQVQRSGLSTVGVDVHNGLEAVGSRRRSAHGAHGGGEEAVAPRDRITLAGIRGGTDGCGISIRMAVPKHLLRLACSALSTMAPSSAGSRAWSHQRPSSRYPKATRRRSSVAGWAHRSPPVPGQSSGAGWGDRRKRPPQLGHRAQRRELGDLTSVAGVVWRQTTAPWSSLRVPADHASATIGSAAHASQAHQPASPLGRHAAAPRDPVLESSLIPQTLPGLGAVGGGDQLDQLCRRRVQHAHDRGDAILQGGDISVARPRRWSWGKA